MELYDLVRVVKSEEFTPLVGEPGIITEVHIDIDDNELYELIFVGKRNNEVSEGFGGALFYEHELEVI